jgi:hypothetical protein
VKTFKKFKTFEQRLSKNEKETHRTGENICKSSKTGFQWTFLKA